MILDGMWTEKASITFEYGFNGAVGFASEERGYIGTGAWSPVAMNEFWCYYPAIDAWAEIDPMPSERLYFCVSFVIDDYAYVGLGKQGGIVLLIQIFID